MGFLTDFCIFLAESHSYGVSRSTGVGAGLFGLREIPPGADSFNTYDPLQGVEKLRFLRGEIVTWDTPFDVRNRDLQYQEHVPGLKDTSPPAMQLPTPPGMIGETELVVGVFNSHPTQRSWNPRTIMDQPGVGKLKF